MKQKYIKVFILLWMVAILLLFLYSNKLTKEVSYAVENQETQKRNTYTEPNAIFPDVETIIEQNTKEATARRQEIVKEEMDLEYITKYQTNPDLPKDTIRVIQEGNVGSMQKIIQKEYIEDELVKEEQIGTVVLKPAIPKMVEIGTGSRKKAQSIKVGDTVYVTSELLSIREKPEETAEKIITLSKNDAVTVIELGDTFYQVAYQNFVGYAQKDCFTLEKEMDQEQEEYSWQGSKTAQELLQNLSKDMPLNQLSGLSIEQFQEILTDSRDTNNVFAENAEYFYYIEQEYHINGVFVAAVAIHESGWGTSALSQRTKNLFGYGAYDRNPGENAYTFDTYAESIDLLARVFSKYYINPKGTAIYGGETAVASHYYGSTVEAVNTDYASDKGWANKVYQIMSNLYHKLS